MNSILTQEQVRKAIYQDADFAADELERLAQTASSFIFQKTDFDFASEAEIEPLAIQCAILYVRQLYLGEGGTNKDYDYSVGITGLLIDLQNLAIDKNAALALLEEEE